MSAALFDSVSRIARHEAARRAVAGIGIVVDLFLSLRDVKAYDAMIDLYARMPGPVQQAKMMREQLAFALNRSGRADEAGRSREGWGRLSCRGTSGRSRCGGRRSTGCRCGA